MSVKGQIGYVNIAVARGDTYLDLTKKSDAWQNVSR